MITMALFVITCFLAFTAGVLYGNQRGFKTGFIRGSDLKDGIEWFSYSSKVRGAIEALGWLVSMKEKGPVMDSDLTWELAKQRYDAVKGEIEFISESDKIEASETGDDDDRYL